MELLLVILGLLFLASPVIAIVALAQAKGANRSIRKAEQTIQLLSKTLKDHVGDPRRHAAPEPERKPNVAPARADIIQMPVPAAPPPAPLPAPLVEKPSPSVQKPQPPPAPKPTAKPRTEPRLKKTWEEALGGQIAGLIGVMILVAGIAFLVGSGGISWPAPPAKILIGIASGLVLLGGGYAAERNTSGKFKILSRIMTGGGGGLFYFCVFAAYSLYHLIGPVATAAGLTVSAAALLLLSLLYNSQTVSCLGVLGAFITPALVGGDFESGAFPLIYIGLVNLPVMFLGVKKDWQVLYNGAYAFTLLHFFYRLVIITPGEWLPLLLATTVYFIEFATLSLLIMRKREKSEAAALNVARIIASSLFLFFSIESIIRQAEIQEGLWPYFSGTTALFYLLAKQAWKLLPKYKSETIAFILCGLASITLLILEQTDGVLRGLLWSIQGTAVMWYFHKSRSLHIHTGSILLSGLGSVYLGQLLFGDPNMEPHFLNIESLALLVSAALMGTSAWINNKSGETPPFGNAARLLWIAASTALLGTAYVDVAKLQAPDIIPWLAGVALFIGLTRLALRSCSQYIRDTLFFALAAILCLTGYVYAQFSGIWMGMGWSLLGLSVAGFNLKAKSTEIHYGGMFVSFLGLIFLGEKALADQNMDLRFFNFETLFLQISALLTGLSAWIHHVFEEKHAKKNRSPVLWMGSFAALLATGYTDIVQLNGMDIFPWLLSTALFGGLAWQTHRHPSGHDRETLCFMQGAILCFAIYLYIQLTGLWIGFSLTLFSIATALFALKIRSKPVQNSSIALGFAGLLHITCQPMPDQALLLASPHTLAGLFAAATIGWQAWLYNRIGDKTEFSGKSRALWFASITAIIIASFRNIFTVLPVFHPLAWLLTSAITLLIGNIVAKTLAKDEKLGQFGMLLITFTPFKILLADTLAVWCAGTPPSLGTPYPWLQLTLLAQVLWLSGKPSNPPLRQRFERILKLAPIIIGLTILSLALWQLQTTWGRAMVSILWGIGALAITLYGFARKSRMHRILALLLFALTVIKVILIDCATFNAGVRVTIFIGVGLLLLILSFTYQKVSEKLLS